MAIWIEIKIEKNVDGTIYYEVYVNRTIQESGTATVDSLIGRVGQEIRQRVAQL